MMIPDCRKRLESSLADLKATLVYAHLQKIQFTFLTFTNLIVVQAELKESNEQGVEIEEAENTIADVETLFQAAEE